MDNILAEQHKLNGIVGEKEAGIAHLRRDVASLQREREAAEDKRAMLKRQVSFLVDAQSGCMLARGDGEKERERERVCVWILWINTCARNTKARRTYIRAHASVCARTLSLTHAHNRPAG